MKFLLAGLLVLSVAQLNAQQPTSVNDEIRNANRAMADAWRRNDPQAIAGMYTDDARIIGPSGSVIEGRANIDRYWAGFPMQSRTWTLDVIEAGGTRDLAYQWGRYTISGGPRSQTADFIGIWRRQANGELRLAVDYWVPVRGEHATEVAANPVERIRELDAGWANTYAKHNTAFAHSLFADDIVITSTNGTLKNKQGELADIRAQPGLVMDYFRTTDVNVSTYGDAAVATGRAEWSFTMNGNKNTVSRRYTATYVRGGPLGWRIVAMHIGRTP